jgi:hypothetical protein
MTNDIVVIREYTSELDAQIAQSVLDANGISAAIIRDDAGGMMPSLHLLIPIRLAVRSQDAEVAVRLLDADEPMPLLDEAADDDGSDEE